MLNSLKVSTLHLQALPPHRCITLQVEPANVPASQQSQSEGGWQGHTDSLTGLAFSSDGSALATTCADRLLRTFSLVGLDPDAKLTGIHRQLREDPVDVAFGADASSLIVLSAGNCHLLCLPSCMHRVLASSCVALMGVFALCMAMRQPCMTRRCLLLLALLSLPSAGLGDEHSVRMYQVDAADKKSLAEVWHVPHVFTRERGRCLKCSGTRPCSLLEDRRVHSPYLRLSRQHHPYQLLAA